MATITPFTPSAYSNFQFQPTLDGQTYTAVVNWNLYAQRYYFNLYTLSNERVFTLPLVGSPLDYDISLTAGYFSTKVIYRAPMQQFEVI